MCAAEGLEAGCCVPAEQLSSLEDFNLHLSQVRQVVAADGHSLRSRQLIAVGGQPLRVRQVVTVTWHHLFGQDCLSLLLMGRDPVAVEAGGCGWVIGAEQH